MAALCFVGISPAQASDQLTVSYAGSVNDDLGTLQVSARSGSDIVELTAHVFSPVTQQEVAVLEPDDFALDSGTAQEGIWRSKAPLQLAEFGSYRIGIEATDADGDHISVADAGTLAYYAVAQFPEFTTDRTAIGVDERDVTVEGVLKAKLPGGGEPVVLPGRKVDIDVDYWTVTTVTTDDDGHFTATVQLDNAAPIQAVYRHDGDHAGYLYGESTMLQIGIDKALTRYTLQTSTQRIDKGQPVTLTGRLEKETENGWVPLSGVSGGILFGPTTTYNDRVGGFTTDADGTFSTQYTPWETGFFQVAHRSDDPFVSNGNARSSTVVVLQPARFLDFSALRTGSRSVHAEGHIDFDNISPATINVAVQYSPDGTSWTTLRTVEATWSGTGGYGFAADLAAKRPGHFRGYFDGGDVFQTITSASTHVGR
ncbi:hypothetical protein [Streptomyces fulvorobeus]|uniref:Uncharacterized protein n=1 Tax=Streptomyces fulvorobeus TaxID=284028 RepID=A0A7Y9HCZ5_9ACTN|nr:hypothetical protein [Streptomyces fulvorobeus]NYE41679.1 hypothetical protein [Streptomyces fulvorobeus]